MLNSLSNLLRGFRTTCPETNLTPVFVVYSGQTGEVRKSRRNSCPEIAFEARIAHGVDKLNARIRAWHWSTINPADSFPPPDPKPGTEPLDCLLDALCTSGRKREIREQIELRPRWIKIAELEVKSWKSSKSAKILKIHRNPGNH